MLLVRKVALDEALDKREEIVRLNQFGFPPAVLAFLENVEPHAIIFEKMREEHMCTCAPQGSQELISTTVRKHELTQDEVKSVLLQERHDLGASFRKVKIPGPSVKPSQQTTGSLSVFSNNQNTHSSYHVRPPPGGTSIPASWKNKIKAHSDS
jgi:hypothetical protein